MSQEPFASPADRSLRPGERLGAYEIDSFLSAGGMGAVYRARDVRLDRTVAIKILPAADFDLRLRFQHEAKVIAALTHPNICTLYDVGQQDRIDYLVMEYLDGQTLADRLARGALRIDQALTRGIEIASALAAAHRAGVIHGDVKPANIMLTKSGAKLLDFGVAKLWPNVAVAVAAPSVVVTQEAPVTRQGLIVGTLQYMAPEQLEGRGCDSRSDLFGFGAVLYEALTGRKAFDGQSQASVVAAILERDPEPLSKLLPYASPELDRVVRKCLAKDREDRWQTAKDLGDELRWVLQSIESRGLVRSEDTESGVATMRTRRKRLPRRRFVFRLTIGFSLSLLLAVLLAARWRNPPASHPSAALPSTDRGVATGPPGSIPPSLEDRAELAARAAQEVKMALAEKRFEEARRVIARQAKVEPPLDATLVERLLVEIAHGEVQAAVEAYAAAYSSRDRNAVLVVDPAVPQQELSDLEKLRTDFKTYEMRITVKSLAISRSNQGDRAQVECAVTHNFVTFAGKEQAVTRNDVLMFERKGSSWVRVR